MLYKKYKKIIIEQKILKSPENIDVLIDVLYKLAHIAVQNYLTRKEF